MNSVQKKQTVTAMTDKALKGLTCFQQELAEFPLQLRPDIRAQLSLRSPR